MNLETAINFSDIAREYVKWIKRHNKTQWSPTIPKKHKDFEVANQHGFKVWLRENGISEERIQQIWGDELVQIIINDELLHTIIKRGVRRNSVELFKIIRQDIEQQKTQYQKSNVVYLANDSEHTLLDLKNVGKD